MAFRETHPQILSVLNRSVANVDSTGLVVLMSFQCSDGSHRRQPAQLRAPPAIVHRLEPPISRRVPDFLARIEADLGVGDSGINGLRKFSCRGVGVASPLVIDLVR